MYSYRHKQRLLAVQIILLACVLVPLSARALVNDETLLSTKTELKELWHAAAETTKRRSTLEQTLAQFDTKVADARRDLTEASDKRKEIRLSIDQHVRLIEALKGQISAAQQTKDFYQGIVESRKEDFVDFIRFIVSRDIARRESGPSAGGDLLKRVLRQSLGEAIEQQMAQAVILKARQKFFYHVDTLLAESERVGLELHASADELSRELNELKKTYGDISTLVQEKETFIDDSWRVKKLTEDELADIAQEAEESMNRITGMQTSLMKVNEELKAQKVAALQKEKDALSASLASLESNRDALKLKDKAMQLLEDYSLRAFQQAMQAKGSDKKLYRKIEDLELKRSNILEERSVLLAGIVDTDPPVIDPAIALLDASLAFIDRTLVLMREGVPQDLAEEYLRADDRATDAKAQRVLLAQQITAISAEAATISVDVSRKAEEIDTIAARYTLSDLPPMFVWPVKGRITAGYLDADYVKVFHVPHRGVDIAVPQGSPVHSVSDGIVYAVRDGGRTGYSYLIVGHRNGYASLYGHVSAFLVRIGDIVDAGQIIALSGGTPDMHGSGGQTTGPHLHLEMTEKGKHIDPLTMLPPV